MYLEKPRYKVRVKRRNEIGYANGPHLYWTDNREILSILPRAYIALYEYSPSLGMHVFIIKHICFLEEWVEVIEEIVDGSV